MTHDERSGAIAARMKLLAAAGIAADSELLDNVSALSSENIQYVVDNVNPFLELAPGGLLGDRLFPERTTQELMFGYIKGANSAAVMAHVTSHNAEAPLVGRRGVETVRGEIPAIKQKRHQDAKTLIQLQSGDEMIQSQAVQDIFDDVTLSRVGVVARLEKLRMDAVATGIVTHITEEGLVFSVDYQVPANHKETLAGTDLWSHADSDPLGDLEAWQNTLVGDNGSAGASIITSKLVLDSLRRHADVRRAVYGVNSDKRLTAEELNEFLASQDLPRFVTHDQMIAQQLADGTRVNVRLWPQNRLTIIPALGETGGLGRTHRAPTAEEAVRGVAEGVIAVDAFRIATHVYVNTNDPKGVVTLSAASTFPSFERADHVFQAQVLA